MHHFSLQSPLEVRLQEQEIIDRDKDISDESFKNEAFEKVRVAFFDVTYWMAARPEKMIRGAFVHVGSKHERRFIQHL